MIENVLLFDNSRIPEEGSPTFDEDASYVWNRINPVLTSFNVATGQINAAYNDMGAMRNEAYTYKNEALLHRDTANSYKNDALLYRNETKAYRDEVMWYVIPTNATLSEDAIKALVASHRTDSFLGFNF